MEHNLELDEVCQINLGANSFFQIVTSPPGLLEGGGESCQPPQMQSEKQTKNM